MIVISGELLGYLKYACWLLVQLYVALRAVFIDINHIILCHHSKVTMFALAREIYARPPD